MKLTVGRSSFGCLRARGKKETAKLVYCPRSAPRASLSFATTPTAPVTQDLAPLGTGEVKLDGAQHII